MTQHDPTVRIRHMLDHAREAVDLLAGKEKADLSSNRVLELALVRLVEIVGEAANRLSLEDQLDTPPFRGKRSSVCGTGWFTVMMRST